VKIKKARVNTRLRGHLFVQAIIVREYTRDSTQCQDFCKLKTRRGVQLNTPTGFGTDDYCPCVKTIRRMVVVPVCCSVAEIRQPG
jgi:hypothetical protein